MKLNSFLNKFKYQNFFIVSGLTVYAINYLSVLNNKVPFYINDVDPTYEYLFNGLNLTNLDKPGHTDHPGTSLQILIALSILIISFVRRNIFTTEKNFEANFDLIVNSESYIFYILIFLLVIHIFSIWYLSINMSKNGIKYWFLFPFILIISGNYFDQIVSLKPESLYLPISNLLCAQIINLSKMNTNENRKRYIPLIGIIMGIGITNKILMVPFFLFFLIVLQMRDKLRFLVITGFTSLVIIIPVKSILNIEWFFQIVFNPGRYGQEGNNKNLTQIPQEILELWIFNYPLVAICFGSIVSNIVINRGIYVKQNKIIFQLSMLIIIYTALIIKQVEYRDFIALSSITSVLLIIILSGNNRFTPTVHYESNKKLIPYLVIFAISIPSYNYLKQILSNLETFSKIQEYKYSVDKNLTVGFYLSPHHAAGLMFGDLYYGPRYYQNEISTLYPNYFEYSIWSGDFHSTGGRILSCQEFKNEMFGKDYRVYTSATTSLQDMFSHKAKSFQLTNKRIISSKIIQTDLVEVFCK